MTSMWVSNMNMWYSILNDNNYSVWDCIFGVITVILLVIMIVFIFYKYL